jgi:O-antigen ligase
MLAALAAYTDHAVLGVGPGQYLPYYSVEYQGKPEISIRELAEPRRAHSLYLEIAAETGTIGLLVFLAIPLLLLRDLGRIRRALSKRRPDLARLAAAFTLSIVAYLGTGAFLHLSYERYYWFMIGLASAAVGVLGRVAAEVGNGRRAERGGGPPEFQVSGRVETSC